MQRLRQPRRHSARLWNSGEAYPGENAQREAAQNANQAAKPQQPAKAEPKVGRNDPCPCGSGKKYKNCHGKTE